LTLIATSGDDGRRLATVDRYNFNKEDVDINAGVIRLDSERNRQPQDNRRARNRI